MSIRRGIGRTERINPDPCREALCRHAGLCEAGWGGVTSRSNRANTCHTSDQGAVCVRYTLVDRLALTPSDPHCQGPRGTASLTRAEGCMPRIEGRFKGARWRRLVTAHNGGRNLHRFLIGGARSRRMGEGECGPTHAERLFTIFWVKTFRRRRVYHAPQGTQAALGRPWMEGGDKWYQLCEPGVEFNLTQVIAPWTLARHGDENAPNPAPPPSFLDA